MQLTKIKADVKARLEDDFQYGGQRTAAQVKKCSLKSQPLSAQLVELDHMLHSMGIRLRFSAPNCIFLTARESTHQVFLFHLDYNDSSEQETFNVKTGLLGKFAVVISGNLHCDSQNRSQSNPVAA